MTDNTSADETVSVDEKRAQYERFDMTVCETGHVNVCNLSHNDDKNHTYTVTVDEKQPESCSCPHWEHREPEGGCKHIQAVSNSPITLSSAAAAGTSTERVAADGGEVVDESTECDHIADGPDDCLICELQAKYDVGETITDTNGDERPAETEAPDMGGSSSAVESGVDEL